MKPSFSVGLLYYNPVQMHKPENYFLTVTCCRNVPFHLKCSSAVMPEIMVLILLVFFLMSSWINFSNKRSFCLCRCSTCGLTPPLVICPLPPTTPTNGKNGGRIQIRYHTCQIIRAIQSNDARAWCWFLSSFQHRIGLIAFFFSLLRLLSFTLH